jgi:hypothetical protein
MLMAWEMENKKIKLAISVPIPQIEAKGYASP